MRHPNDHGKELISRMGESKGWFKDPIPEHWQMYKGRSMTWGEYTAKEGLNPWMDFPFGKNPNKISIFKRIWNKFWRIS